MVDVKKEEKPESKQELEAPDEEDK